MRKGTRQPLDASLKPPSDITNVVRLKRALPANERPTNEAKSGEMVRGDGVVSQTLSAKPTDEYVSAGGYVWLARFIKALPFYIDDTTRDFGDDLYERMMLDPQINASINVLKSAVLASGISVQPALDEEGDGSAFGSESSRRRRPSSLASEIADFCKRNLDNLARPLHDVLYEMLDALALGNKAAEQVYYIPESGPDAGRLCLRALKIKPRRSLSFVVDVYFNVIGIIGLIPGQGAPVIVETIIGEPSQVPNLLPRAKFAVFTNRAVDGDPRGTSLIRPAYSVWWLKMQVWAEYLKYLTQFAGPSLIGYTAQNAQTYVDPVSGQTQNPEQVMLATLVQFRNGTAAVFPFGAKVEPLKMEGDGKAFLEAIDLFDRQITKAILYQTLATEEGEHMARAAGETHQDILGLQIRAIKASLIAMLVNDVLRPLVRYNFGDDAAQSMTPTVSLGETEHQDFASDAGAVALLNRAGFLHVSQYAGIDQMLGLPERDLAAQAAQIRSEERAIGAGGELAQAVSEQTDRQLARERGEQVVGRLGVGVNGA
jgi:hypothetical protein